MHLGRNHGRQLEVLDSAGRVVCHHWAFDNVNRYQAQQSDEEDAGQRQESNQAQCVIVLDLTFVGETKMKQDMQFRKQTKKRGDDSPNGQNQFLV